MEEPPPNRSSFKPRKLSKISRRCRAEDVTFTLRESEIHALCGENGAGKSTLIKLLSGSIRPVHTRDSFSSMDCWPSFVRWPTPNSRIAVIYQELALVNDMTSAKTFLGSEPRTAGGLIDWHKVYQEARLLLEKFKVDIDPSMP